MKFEVGTFLRFKRNIPDTYGITNSKMLLGRVLSQKALVEGNDIYIEVLKHKVEVHEGTKFPVNSEFFEPCDKDGNYLNRKTTYEI